MSKQNNMRSLNWRQRGWRSVGWKNSDVTVEAPADSILHWDADIDAFTEQTGGVHKFNHAVLSPQYQRNADGSYANVGAKPAVDVFGGQKWLRSCGAVQNLLPSGAENLMGSAWTRRGTATAMTQNADGSYRVTLKPATGEGDIYISSNIALAVSAINQIEVRAVSGSNEIRVTDKSGAIGTGVTAKSVGASFETITSINTVAGQGLFIKASVAEGVFDIRFPLCANVAYPVPYVPPGVTQPASNATTTNGVWFALPDGSPLWQALDGQADGVELVTNGGFANGAGWSATAPSVVTGGEAKVVSVSGESNSVIQTINGVILGNRVLISFDYRLMSGQAKVQPGSGASVGNTISLTTVGSGKISRIITWDGTDKNLFLTRNVAGVACECYFDNISVQRIQPQPLTLATRVRMGVGSGDLPNGTTLSNAAVLNDAISVLHSRKSVDGTVVNPARSYDGTTVVPAATSGAWGRLAIIRNCVQVNQAGTQFRVGYMIEGTHTAIQWSSWAAFDGSFNPSTLYRLMLGLNNTYPMWFNKITAWRKQVSDAEILEAMA